MSEKISRTAACAALAQKMGWTEIGSKWGEGWGLPPNNQEWQEQARLRASMSALFKPLPPDQMYPQIVPAFFTDREAAAKLVAWLYPRTSDPADAAHQVWLRFFGELYHALGLGRVGQQKIFDYVLSCMDVGII